MDRRWGLQASTLLLLGAALRLWAVGSARFTGDEASFWDTARAIAALERFPVLGPEITGAPAHLPGPLFHYLTALPQLLGASPYLGGWFMALLHVGAGALLARFALDARGPRAALLALALWAFAPWDVLYGDRVWASCLAPALGALTLFAAHRAHEDARWLTPLIVLAGALPQVHLSAPLVWVAAGVLVLLRPPAPGRARPAALGAALVILLYLPFLVVELGSGFANTRAILAHSGGTETGLGVSLVPLKVFGYAVLYASGELGYQFARGYWGGGFDELAAYGRAEGWRAWLEAHGPLLGLLVGLSVLLAALGWLRHLVALPGELARALRARRRPGADAALGLALLAGLGAGAVLMMSARKTFFPHYANILVPFALWPAVSGLDRVAERLGRAGRATLGAAVGLAALGMGLNTARYYREVDGLNGLGTTLRLVERVLETDGPVDVRFTHFRNTYAWRKLARGYFGGALELDPRAPTRFVVHNRAAGEGRGTPVGPAHLERVERAAARPPEGTQWAARRDLEGTAVTVRGAPGLSGCRAGDDGCRYGEAPWQRVEPTHLAFAGRLEPVVFIHPVSTATVSLQIPRPSGATRAVLRFGLTDEAHQSTNRAPVQVVLSSGERRLLVDRTSAAPGLTQREITLPEASGPLELSIWTEDDGARVFGFDLWLVSDRDEP